MLTFSSEHPAIRSLHHLLPPLLVLPEGQFDTPAGASVQAIRLDDPVHQLEPGF